MSASRQELCGERPRMRGPPKAQPVRKRSGTCTTVSRDLWRAAAPATAPTHRRGAARLCRARSLRSKRTEGPRARSTCRQFSVTTRSEVAMGLKTPLYDVHVASGAKIIDFGGWDMPLQYGSQLEEHRSVRRDAGIFDVSHMCVVDLSGPRVRAFLRFLLANDVGRLAIPGRALYSCMLLPDGGVIDDLIVYFVSESWFRLVVNAGTRRKDLAWIEQHAAPFGVSV